MIAGSGLAQTSCETTGDPNSGGIFWSQSKADERLSQRQSTLDRIDSDTSRVDRRNRQMQQRLDQ